MSVSDGHDDPRGASLPASAPEPVTTSESQTAAPRFWDPTEGLPVIESCEGCGACCLEQGAPPDYTALWLNPQHEVDPSFAEDGVRMRNLPAEARELLDDYMRRYVAGEADSTGTCVWFDEVTRGCRFYESRPSTCRVFELSSMGCRIYRKRNGFAKPGELPPAGT